MLAACWVSSLTHHSPCTTVRLQAAVSDGAAAKAPSIVGKKRQLTVPTATASAKRQSLSLVSEGGVQERGDRKSVV